MKRREAIGLAAGGGLATLLSERTARAEAQVEQARRGLPSPKITDVRAIATAPRGLRLVVVKVTTDQDGLYGYGCATYTQISLDQVDLGDEVRVSTVDGEEHEFEVTFVGDKAIGGGGVSVSVDEIHTVERHHDSLGWTIVAGLFSIKETRFYILCGLIFVILVLVV